MQREAAISKRIMAHLKGMGAFVIKLHGGAYQKRGMPDIHALLDGVPIYVEVKAPGGALTAIQSHRIMEIRNAGGLAFVARSVEDVDREIEEYLNGEA